MSASEGNALPDVLDVLREAVKGGTPGEGTIFLDGTEKDGSGNAGLLATVRRLSAEQASRDLYGTSIAGQLRHTAFHMEVMVRWERDGDRGPFDWKGSFHPLAVSETEWQALQAEAERRYREVTDFVQAAKTPAEQAERAGALAGAAAHVAYHLGSIRQMIKLLD